MKRFSLFVLFCTLFTLNLSAQALRYFEFKTECGYGRWQDSSFVVATNNTALIDTVLANIARPEDQRKMINGNIAHGNAGYNHNADYWFKWHFVPDEWTLVDMAMEVCDGCPYSDIDADTAYWIGNIGFFCPWTSKPVREIEQPTSIKNPMREIDVDVYPNPAKDKLYLNIKGKEHPQKTVVLALYNTLGERKFERTTTLTNAQKGIDISELAPGLYLLNIRMENVVLSRKIVIL